MSCDAYLELLQAHIDNESSAADEKRLQAHLAQCNDCRLLLSAYLQADAGLAALNEDAPAGLKDSILQSLPAQEKKSRHFGRYAGIILAAAAALTLVIGFGAKLPSLGAKKAESKTDVVLQQKSDALQVYGFQESSNVSASPTETPTVPDADITKESSPSRHLTLIADELSQTTAIVFNRDRLSLVELEEIVPQETYYGVDDLSAICGPLADSFEEGLYDVCVYELDVETFLSVADTYENILPIVYADRFLSETVCLYLIVPTE